MHDYTWNVYIRKLKIYKKTKVQRPTLPCMIKVVMSTKYMKIYKEIKRSNLVSLAKLRISTSGKQKYIKMFNN